MADPREPIEDWIDEALVADVMWMRASHPIVFVSPSRSQVRAMIEAVAPLVAAAERERVTGLFSDWIEILMSEPNAHPPSAWKSAFADLIKISDEKEPKP